MGKKVFGYGGALLWTNLENAFKLSKSAKEFRCQILRCDGPACQCQTCVLCTLNVL